MKTAFVQKKRYLLSLASLLLLLSLLLLSCSATAVRDDSTTRGETESEATEDAFATVGGGKKRVALTFDDGPHNVRTPAIVDELNKYGYRATFFVVGNRVDGTAYSGGDAMLYAMQSGNEIAIHGYTHSVYYNKCSQSEYAYEMTETRRAILEKAPNAEIRLMRPIGGAISEERVASNPFSVILWDVDSEDWKYKYTSGDGDAECREKVNTIVENVLASVKDGSIILMHDIYESTYDAVVILLARLHEMGYEVVTVSELLGDGRAAGRIYESGRIN